MRQHGAQRSEAPKRQRSPQHADLAHTSAARRGQGHAQKIIQNLTLIILCNQMKPKHANQ
ncbi:MAG: hypothetical protein NZ455_06875 [Bacteroidia bacterium]|nr:hypothetical protein [Bacteroidia bacterium]MDW8345877.1 hypothetical protein [Bacteroidia bacterium]